MANIELQSNHRNDRTNRSNSGIQSNSKRKSNMFSLCSRSSDEEQKQRTLRYDQSGEYRTPESQQEEAYIANRIKTSKYSILTFVPLNLFEQVIRPANFYFCIIAALQSIPPVSISGGTPTILVPLVFVFTVTAIKDALEDLKRHRDDNAENRREVEILQPDGSYITKRSQDIHVGEIVRIHDRQRFPADLLLVTSAKGHAAPYCYVETSNIDGETNLKLKQSPEGLNSLPSFDSVDRESLRVLMKDERASKSYQEFKKRINECLIIADPPNGHLDSWSGSIRNLDVPVMREEDDNAPDMDEKEDFKLFQNDFSSLSYGKKNVNLSVDNLLLRGSELRNSDWIYGVVMYTGFDCKIFMNNQSRQRQRIKRSSVEKLMGRFIGYMAAAQFFICLMCAILAGDWSASNQDAWYLYWTIPPELDGFYKFFTWFIIFAQFIPISLLVSMEVVKFIQAQFMQWDINMYTRLRGKTDKFCTVQNSNLNEELGQIDFVFSDKTGTLTDNSLDFRKCVIGNENYGRGETEIGRAAKRREEEMQQQIEYEQQLSNVNPDDDDGSQVPFRIQRMYTSDIGVALERNNNAPHVNFDEERRLRKQLKITCAAQQGADRLDAHHHAMMVRRFLTVLAINNSCFPVIDEETGELSIRAASPDDECLTCFAQFMGVQLSERNPPSIKVDIYPDGLLADDGNSEKSKKIEERWEQLAEFEFTSKRKRMSVVLRNLETGKIHFTMKGADSEMIRLVDGWKKNKYSSYVEKYLEEYSEQGLRTLVIGEAILDADWWDNPESGWKNQYLQFQEDTLMQDERDEGHIKGSCGDHCRKCAWYERIELEAKCELLGCTAIEDKLQESVPETISAMLDGGINVWVLTGDKQKTAENIGIACNLLEPSMERHGLLFKLTCAEPHQLADIMQSAIETISKFRLENKYNKQNAGLVLNSTALKTIMDLDQQHDQDLQSLFLTLAKECKSVIGVRLQPNQKAQIVEFIAEQTGARTLAIGDGTNDEPMIRAANVGVGIAGLEGTAAVRASDYAIGKFKFLKRLMFVHGRLHYKRITTLVCYMFYKNGLLSLSSFYFGFYNGFSGQILYNEWAYQLYNIVFTCVPILLYAVIDRDHTDKYLIHHPQLYHISQSGEYFNPKVFFTWIAESLLAAFLLIFIPLSCYDVTSPDHTAQSAGIWTVGIVILTAIVFVANIRLTLITNSWIWVTHFFLWGSIAAYFLAIIVLNTSNAFAKAGSDYFWTVFRAMNSGRFWLTVFVSTLIALYIPFTYVSFTTLRRNAKIMENEHSARSFNSIQSNLSSNHDKKKKKNNGGLFK